MIDKIKKTWYNVKKRVKERLPCKKIKAERNYLKVNLQINKKSLVKSCFCLLLSFLLLPISLNFSFLADAADNDSALSTVKDLEEYKDAILDENDIITFIHNSGGGAQFAAYFATAQILLYLSQQPEFDINVSDGTPTYDVITGFYRKERNGDIYFGTLYPCTTNGGTMFVGSSGIKYTLRLEANSGILNDIDITNNIVVAPNYNSFFYYFSRSTSSGYPFFATAVASGDSYFQDCVMYNDGYRQKYLMTKFSYSSSISDIGIQPFQQNTTYSQFCLFGCGSWFVPPNNPPDWEAIKAMTPDARKTEIDRYIKDVLNVYTLQQNPELEPFLYYPPTPEPTEPTEPSIYDPDNEPSDLFGWLRLIVQAIISLISGIVRPVVNAINAVFGAISDGFAAVLAFLGGLFTPDISIIQTEIDFIQAKFAFVGQVKLFVNDFLGVLTGYDGSPPDVITVDFDNSNTGFLSNVVGKAVLIDLSWFTPYRLTVHAILSAMLWVFYLWRLFHQLPAVVAGQAAVEHMAEDAAKNP